MQSEEPILNDIKNTLADDILEWKSPRKRRLFIAVPLDKYRKTIDRLVNTLEIKHLSTMTGIDTGRNIEVLNHLFGRGVEVTVRVSIPRENPKLSTITDIMPGATMYEREVHDLLGVEFEGHPNLTRLVLPDDWPEDAYPLRKDFKVQRPEPTRS